MLDNALINLLATQLESASAQAGWNYLVSQKDQPTQQGIPYAPTIYFEKLFDSNLGWAGASYAYQAIPDNFAENETQVITTTFQISALVIQDPTNLAIPTASDVVNYMRMFLMSRANIRTLEAQNVGVLRVTEVRNPAFQDDRDRYEYSPSFDVALTHTRTITATVGACTKAVPTGNKDYPV